MNDTARSPISANKLNINFGANTVSTFKVTDAALDQTI